MMDRPVRRSRQRLPATGLIGLLPEEEAAINRALHESLVHEKKKSPAKNKQSTKTSNDFSIRNLSSDTQLIAASPNSSMEVEMNDPVEGSSSLKLPGKQGRLHSPLSPSQSLDSFCESKSSSPTNSGAFGGGMSSSSVSSPQSIESSLKLVLSTSSWSRSSSSSWSPSPEPGGSTNSSGKVAQKPSRVVHLLPKLKTSASAAQVKVKGKRGRPRKYPPKDSKLTPCKGTKGGSAAPKIPKTYTKAALRLHGVYPKKTQTKQNNKSKNKRERVHTVQQSREMDRPPLSPEAALVLHDHCYSGISLDEDGAATTADVMCNVRSSSYTAQRKFTHNQVPTHASTRPSREGIESVSELREIPKTEDFINFLCLRGSDSMPKYLEKFSFPWTYFQPKNAPDVCIRHKALPFPAVKGSKPKSRNVAKKLGASVGSIPALGSH